ncbi:hypothetical protein [Amycolatopsis sp. NPDC059021]|uniref:phage shock envelope stress response protein PspM n=1 Tax=Amycolatopsis sp. NPDC059021 TaxID=3346704 RepID=UPI00366D0310
MGDRRRRDWRGEYNDLSAKLEKHIERLPDYAQRAQEKLQRYFPPDEQSGGKPAQRPPMPARPPMPRRPAMPPVQRLAGMSLSSMAEQVPVVADAKAKWDRWNQPAAKLERRKRRASRAMTLWILLTILCGIYMVAAGTGVLNAAGAAQIPQAIAALAGVVVFGTFGVRSGMRLRSLNRVELPAAPAGPPPLPPAGSMARQPMERLAESEASLAELLRQLSTPSSAGVAAVPDISVADARNTADEAAKALRGLADRIQALERGRDAAPAREKSALEAAVRKMREQLDDGLDGYGALLAAAGRAVAASGDGGLGASKDALTDATDRLAGLAMALRELSS